LVRKPLRLCLAGRVWSPRYALEAPSASPLAALLINIAVGSNEAGAWEWVLHGKRRWCGNMMKTPENLRISENHSPEKQSENLAPWNLSVSLAGSGEKGDRNPKISTIWFPLLTS